MIHDIGSTRRGGGGREEEEGVGLGFHHVLRMMHDQSIGLALV